MTAFQPITLEPCKRLVERGEGDRSPLRLIGVEQDWAARRFGTVESFHARMCAS
jgi:hypothetical protein